MKLLQEVVVLPTHSWLDMDQKRTWICDFDWFGDKVGWEL